MDMLSTLPRTIGMDLGDKFSHLYVIEADGEVSEQTRVKTTKRGMTTYFERCPRSRVAMEVGTHSRWVSVLVSGFGHEVLVANARKLRAIYENDNKTDLSDPQLLAEIARVQPSLLRPIQHRGESAQSVRAVIHARDCLVSARTKLINHIRGTVKGTGERLTTCSAESFCRHLDELPDQRREALEPLMDVIATMTQKIRDYDRKIAELGQTAFPETELLRQIGGVGPVTALAFVSTIEDPNRFPQTRKVGSALGLRPRLDQSGQTDKQLRITKAGDGLLRRLLVSCAQYILGIHGPDTDLRRWGLKLAERGGKNGKKRAIVAVARKLAVLMLTLWKTKAVYEPLRLANRQAKTDAVTQGSVVPS